jgi:hypothetical protein
MPTRMPTPMHNPGLRQRNMIRAHAQQQQQQQAELDLSVGHGGGKSEEDKKRKKKRFLITPSPRGSSESFQDFFFHHRVQSHCTRRQEHTLRIIQCVGEDSEVVMGVRRDPLGTVL